MTNNESFEVIRNNYHSIRAIKAHAPYKAVTAIEKKSLYEEDVVKWKSKKEKRTF
jgi:hypothetical protein